MDADLVGGRISVRTAARTFR